ncbi:hypothetical protein GCM10025734_02750 [Kitasatospora paranensis]
MVALVEFVEHRGRDGPVSGEALDRVAGEDEHERVDQEGGCQQHGDRVQQAPGDESAHGRLPPGVRAAGPDRGPGRRACGLGFSVVRGRRPRLVVVGGGRGARPAVTG